MWLEAEVEIAVSLAPAVTTRGRGRMALTRRNLLEHIGAIGGAGATYLAMEALGLAVPTPAGAEKFTMPPSSGKGRCVVILGAGVGEVLCAPTSCRKQAIAFTILEARDRIGGRAWTIRGGDKVEQIGRPDQHADSIRNSVSTLVPRASLQRIA